MDLQVVIICIIMASCPMVVYYDLVGIVKVLVIIIV